MKPIVPVTLGMLALATGAQAAPADDLRAELRAACRAGALPPVSGVSAREHGIIDAKSVQAALAKTYPVSDLLYLRPQPPLEPKTVEERELVAQSRLTNAQWLARRAYPADRPPLLPAAPAAKADAVLVEMGHLVDSWVASGLGMPLDVGGLRIVAPGLDREAVLARLLAGEGAGMTLVCRWPVAPREPPAQGGGQWNLVRTPEDLDKTEFKQRKFAEFSYADDRQTRVQSWGVVATAAWKWPEVALGSNGRGGYNHFTPRVYVAYDRKGENDPNADGYVNNLTFGGRVTGDFGAGSDWFGYYALAAAIETDDDFESEAYAVEARLDPLLPPLPYHRFEQGLGSGRALLATAVWNVDLVADWVQVDDPGRKAALKDAAEYVRLGYDASFRVRVGPARQPWGIALVTAYSVRDGQTADGGDAQLFTSALQFESDDRTNYAFGLSYERGENLKSFKSSELWKLFFGLRF